MRTDPCQSAVALTLFVVLLTASLHAQNPRGSLRGTVQDAAGARVVSARIVAQLSGLSIKRDATSEDRGEFRMDDLLPGNYHVTVSATGFSPAEAEVTVAVATVRDITVTMKPAAARERVNVQGNSSSITTEVMDTSSAVRGGVVGSHDLETLPLPARSFANLEAGRVERRRRCSASRDRGCRSMARK